MKHVLSALVQDQPGVLVRVAGMFTRRGFNIESLAVGRTHIDGYSRMTVVVSGDHSVVEQVIKQLRKILEVVSVQLLSDSPSVTRGMALLKVNAGERRSEVLKLAEVFRANVVDISEPTVTLEITGDDEKIRAFTELMAPFGIAEMVSTGQIGLKRGSATIYQFRECGYYEQNVL
ncbi:MAG: acetolactate synthase small subunit [Negativicutes bacterium]|nr:acetolactate synthase small subunit [Negativicutes bacterium]